MNRNAEDENAMAPCSNATLEGRFLFTEAGFEPNESKLVPFAISGYQDNANGKAEGDATYIVNGEINPPESYRVKPRRNVWDVWRDRAWPVKRDTGDQVPAVGPVDRLADAEARRVGG
jgi:hypothetical protein